MTTSSDAPGADLLRDAYSAFGRVILALDEDRSWTTTGCRGWTIRDLTYHCLADAQRGLVALHSPSGEPADRDAVSYWRDWAQNQEGAAQGRRFTRVGASMFLIWGQLRDLYLETSAAVVDAALGGSASQAVVTQGHVLTSDDLLRTLCVEATIHHLDLVLDLPGSEGPAPSGLHEVRRVLDGLVGHEIATEWADERYARVATGRGPLTAEEASELGQLALRFPLFS
jgi:hypothetical protein